MKTLKSKIALACAGVLLATSMASAQAVGTISVGPTSWEDYMGDPSITFGVTVVQENKIEVKNINLSDTTSTGGAGGLLLSTAGATIAHTDLDTAAFINVKTNLAGWDVRLNLTNSGNLTNSAAPAASRTLNRIRNGVTSPATLKLNACVGAGPYKASTAFLALKGATPAVNLTGSCARPGNIAQFAATLPAATVSLATTLGRTSGFSKSANGDTDGYTHFVLYAGVEAAQEELVGNGLYTETVQVTLLSWY